MGELNFKGQALNLGDARMLFQRSTETEYDEALNVISLVVQAVGEDACGDVIEIGLWKMRVPDVLWDEEGYG